jgi:hypothetical protein
VEALLNTRFPIWEMRVRYQQEKHEMEAMTYRGRIENGKVVLDESVELPEGAEVKVDLLGEDHDLAELR